MRYFVSAFALFLLLALFTTPSDAAYGEKEGLFWAALEGSASQWNELVDTLSGGTGYTSSGPWYFYPSTTGQMDRWGNPNLVPSWWNQWYYDDPYDPTRWKEVTLTFDLSLINPMARGGAIIVINWSTDWWTDETQPPMSNTDASGNELVGRQEVHHLWIDASPEDPDPLTYTFSGMFDLRDWGIRYNPVWISIDISGYNVLLSSPTVPGSIIHKCVPEPSTLILMLAGAGMLLMVRWLRRR